MKRFAIIISFVLIIFTFSACSDTAKETKTVTDSAVESTQTASEVTQNETQATEMKIKINVNGNTFSATLEDNAAAKEFYEIIKTEGLTVEMSDYSGFEKVGSLGRTLSANDVQTRTKSGDIVLYNSSQLVMFYGSNSWSYTRLGRIDNLNGWEDALGSGNITAEFYVG